MAMSNVLLQAVLMTSTDFIATNYYFYYMIFRVNFLLVASAAAFAVTQIKINYKRKHPKNDSSNFQQEQNQTQENDKFKCSILAVEPKQEEEEEEFKMHDKKWNIDTEIELLRNIVNEMEQKRVTLELKLLELYGLKQQQLDSAPLPKHLKTKTIEIDVLNGTINALKAEIKRLHEEITENQLAEKQLEIAKKRIVDMQAKIFVKTARMKGQLMMVKEQLLSHNNFEETSIKYDKKVDKKLRAMKGVEMEVLEMKRRNKELQLEIRDLTVKLVAPQARTTAFSNKTQSKVIAKVEEEMSGLRHANENLLNQVEILQKNRFSIVEELVYQRWLNACLRFEKQDCQTTPRKTPNRNLSKKPCYNSQGQAKPLVLDTNFDSISSHTYSVESDETTTTTINSYSSSQKSTPNRTSLIHSIKRWGRSRRSKDDSNAIALPNRSIKSLHKGLIRRFSMSAVPSADTSGLIITPSRKIQAKDYTTSPETPVFPRVRRVSFSDSVKTVSMTFQDIPKSVDMVSDNEQQISGTISKSGGSSKLGKEDNEKDAVEAQMVSRSGIARTEDMHSGMANVARGDSEDGDHMVHLIAAVVIFFFLIVYFYCVFLSYCTH